MNRRTITAFLLSAALASCVTATAHAALTLPYEASLTAMDTEVTVRRNGPGDQTELELEHGGNVTTVYLSDVNRVRVAYMLEHATP